MWARCDQVNVACTTGIWAPKSQYSEEHNSIILLSLVTIAIYPAGVLVFQAVLLILARHAITSGRPTNLSKATNFLHRQYKPHFYCARKHCRARSSVITHARQALSDHLSLRAILAGWELMAVSRRMFLCGVMVLVARGTITQLMIGSAYILSYMLLKAQATPFKDMADDFVESATNFALTLISLSCLCFKVAALTKTLAQGDSVPADQVADMQIDPMFLSILMSCALFSALVVSTLVFFSMFQRERMRMRQEKKASKLRRLRYKTDQTEVDVPQIPKGHFHTFLSHVWATGQGIHAAA